MNRADRRRAAKADGVDWADVRRARRAQEVAMRLTPEQAREALARWAAQPGRSQAEVDALNAKNA
jgi:hypothetical protein